MLNNIAKSYDILATSLSVLHNYFDEPTKLFLDIIIIVKAMVKAKVYGKYIIDFFFMKSR